MYLVIEALRGRSSRLTAGLLLGSALFVAGAWADPVEVLQGAWVGESTDCTLVFEKIQRQIRFKDRTYASDDGFIVTGSKAKGPIGGSCTISQIGEENDRFSALLSCSDAVVSRKFSWSFRIIDATHFESFDTKVIGDHLGSFNVAMVRPRKYKKCAF